MKLSRAIFPTLAAFALTSCFTGIESTPRIDSGAVRDAGVTVSAEEALMEPVRPEPPATWRPGKLWRVDNDRIAVIFTPTGRELPPLAGRTLSLLDTENYIGMAGDTLVELTFVSRGDTLRYRSGVTAADMARRRSLEVPFAIELSPVTCADSLLRGRRLFITTPNWRDADGQPVAGLRHVPVTVDSVSPGTAQYPLRVWFSPENGGLYSVLLTYGHGAAATRNFDRVFAFGDPRLRYPRITPETWELIINSRVREGMTRDEARLALGAPASINRTGNNAGQYERWNYDQGIYLIFEDGILIRFRQ